MSKYSSLEECLTKMGASEAQRQSLQNDGYNLNSLNTI